MLLSLLISTIALGPGGIAVDFAGRGTVTRGISGDERYVFVGETFAGRIVVLDRLDGHEVGQLAAPPGGYILPFGPKLKSQGWLYVLDAGGFPQPGVIAVPRVHLYRYWTDRHGFHSEVTRTDDFTAAFAGQFSTFASDLAVLPDGGYVLTEQISGGLYRVTPSGQIISAITQRAELGGCFFPPGTVVDFAGIPFSFFGDFAPGANYLAHNGHELFWESPCAGGIFATPLSSLYTTAPATIRKVSSAVLPAEILGGMSFNPYTPRDRDLYVTNPYRSEIIAVNTRTGARRSVVSHPVLFNSPANVAFLPPVLGLTPLLVASSQEHRLAAINSQIPADLVQPPWVITKVFVLPR